jgi:transposase
MIAPSGAIEALDSASFGAATITNALSLVNNGVGAGDQGKKLSNKDLMSKTDPDAKVAEMKDGSTHFAYKPEHAVDLDTGVTVAAPIHAADEGDTTTLGLTLEMAEKNLSAGGVALKPEGPCGLVADKGYYSRDVLKEQDGGPWKTRIAEPRPSNGYLRWHGDDEARAAVYANRNRLRSGVGKEAMRKRGGRAQLCSFSRTRRYAPHMASRS